MSKSKCSPEQKAACPLRQKNCFRDTHHLGFEARNYQTKVEREWRDKQFNKIDIPRCVHNAIHNSGYEPEKPPREVMLEEIYADKIPLRAIQERTNQLAIGQAVMQGERNYFERFRNGVA